MGMLMAGVPHPHFAKRVGDGEPQIKVIRIRRMCALSERDTRTS